MKRKLLIALGVLIVSGLVFAAVETKFYGNINLQNYKVVNMGTPTSNGDGANKSYVDTQVHTRLNKQGGQLTGTLDMQTNYIVRVKKPRSGVNGKLDATPRDYVDGATNAVRNYANSTFLPLGGGTMSGVLSMGSQKITDLGTPTASTDGVNKGYVDLGDSAKLNLSGGTMMGQISMGGYRIFNLGSPSANKDATTKEYVDSVINNANSYQYFALKKGSGYTPIYHLSSNTNRQFSVVVLRQFTGSLTSYVENIHGVASWHYASKTWKVGETIKVPFGLGPETFSETNGTLVIKGGSGVLGNFGITAPPNGLTPFTCEAIIGGNTYAPNTSVQLSGTSWNSGTKCFTFKIKNTSGRTITSTTLNALSVSQYVSSVNYTSTSLDCVETAQTIVVPNNMTISSWANNMELTFKLYVIDIDSNYGFRWNFQISADGSTYTFGQFFLPNVE